jgi:hypothetical protein
VSQIHVIRRAKQPQTYRYLNNNLASEALQSSGCILVSFRKSVPRHTVLHVTPAIRCPSRGNHSRMPATTSNLCDTQPNQAFDTLWCATASLVAMAQLAIPKDPNVSRHDSRLRSSGTLKKHLHAPAPRVQRSITRDSRRVVGTTSDLNHNLPCHRLYDARNILPPIVAVTQTTIIASTCESNGLASAPDI